MSLLIQSRLADLHQEMQMALKPITDEMVRYASMQMPTTLVFEDGSIQVDPIEYPPQLVKFYDSIVDEYRERARKVTDPLSRLGKP